jgi:hypothetical protein
MGGYGWTARRWGTARLFPVDILGSAPYGERVKIAMRL